VAAKWCCTATPSRKRWRTRCKLVDEKGYVYVHPYDDPHTIAGQGTVAMEILRQHPAPLDAIFVPVGGGGLIAGIAAYVKYLRPEIKIIGVEPDDSNCLQAAMAAGERVVLPAVGIFADGVAVAQIGQHTFDICKDYVDEVITVSTDEICAAIKDIYDDTRSITEPAGALGVAGIKKYVEQPVVSAARPLSPLTPGPTSTSTACAMWPSAPSWVKVARRSLP
jgi:threonine dehydratase